MNRIADLAAGGWQVAALHRSDSHLYVLMHQGHHWTHKDAGTEVWELDAPSHRLVRRLKLGVPVNSIAVSQDAHPVLYGVAETGTWIVIDLATGRQRGRLDGLGDGFMLATAQGE